MFRLHITQDPSPEISKRAFTVARREGHKAVGEYWHKHYLPLHFRADARHRYGHKPRDFKYLRRKINLARRGIVKLGGLVDNVFSGALMRIAMASGTIRIFPSRVTITFSGPPYVRMRFWLIKQPDKAKELTTVRNDEGRQLDMIGGRTIEKYVARARGKKTIRI